MTPRQACDQLVAALGTVAGLRVVAGLGMSLIPPVVIVDAPTLTWDGYCGGGPSRATWTLFLLSDLTTFAAVELLSLIGTVATAIEKETSATVTTAVPGVYPGGDQGDFPSYLITAEMELTD